jgi:TP901 family phage tail tape measure protein
MALDAGTAYVTILPNMGKFGPALAAGTKSSAGLKALGVGAAAVGAGLAVSVKMATDFEQSMRNVNSIAKLSEGQFKNLGDDVLALAGPTAQAPKTLADGLYDLVSSGFDAKDSLVILEASAKAATAGLTTTDVATKGVAAVLNAYRLPASKAAEVSDQLFRTVDRGVISFDELSGGIGDTLPFAAALGVGLDEVGAATATMTKQGLSGAETFTRIRNLLQTMIKPGEDLSAAIRPVPGAEVSAIGTRNRDR